MNVLHINQNQFEDEVLKSSIPVVVDFYADWCGPCQMLKPVLDEIGKETDEFKIVKVNVDEAGELSEKYGVFNIPTLIIFKDGQKVNKFIGYQGKDVLLKNIKASL